ncbi:methionine--tRNA ligase subunit beta [archaeon]|jgi:methionine--tRNA ligase beta chain|nr:methionine--tRNA ligase subunit beta [archaeon]MBT6182480.1 methionine--tRNA ligase subunit beta [archaeon]MBT6606632.1 methionine--tRNA ligase subunit beta [archaeon]MBT7251875.1 methionine--tRNA ligase subunit beta [archaeon]MBT7660553.1 methionine--tRNA ligase subunit beta [archaeon]
MENVAMIEYEDFSKLDMRVAEIQTVENIEGADKLYKLEVSIGEELRTICAGIKEYYSHDELLGKKIIVLTNLKPRKLRGIESQGMLLAAGNSDHTKISLITPDQEIEVGSKVS